MDFNSKDELSHNNKLDLKHLILKTQEWGRYLISKWYILVIVSSLCAILGICYSIYKKPIYTATTTFVLESGEGGSGNLAQYAGIASMVGIELGGSGGGIFQGDNIIELYKSRKMIEASLLTNSKSDTSQLLIDRLVKNNGSYDRWKEKSPELLDINFKNQNQELGSLQRKKDSILMQAFDDINMNYLKVTKPDAKLSIIKVDVSSKDEIFAKEFNDAIVTEVNDFYIQTKTKKSLDNIEILQYKTDSVRSVMNGSISAAAVAIDATPNLNPTRQAQRLVPTQRSQFSAETNKAILGQLIQNLEMAKMSLLKEAPLIQEIDNPIYPLEKHTFSKKKGFLVGLLVGAFLAAFLIMVRYVFQNIMK